MEQHNICSKLHEYFHKVYGIITNQTKEPCMIIKGDIVIDHNSSQSSPGKSVCVQIYSRTKVDTKTGNGKLSAKAYLKRKKSTDHNGRKTTYGINFSVEEDFGIPGAFIVENQLQHKFFLRSATLQTPCDQLIHFTCNSWVYPVQQTQASRIFFSNTSYLPSETPRALVLLRKEELISLRGSGTGERNEWDRIYDYDNYNDLGDPGKGPEHQRPILGGSRSHPYPRRGRTGNRHCKNVQTGSQQEMVKLDVYVPPDERFSPEKMSEFIGNALQAILHFVVPEAKSLLHEDSKNFQSFDEILGLLSNNRNEAVEEETAELLMKFLPFELFKEISRASKVCPMRFPLPQIVANNELAWMDDEEFGRQMLAGVNPTLIRVLQEFPPRSRNGITSSIMESQIQHNLDSLTIYQAMQQWRIFILDHHDYLMPFLSRINTNGICAYASRTLLFLRNDGTLKPLAIELTLPGAFDGEEINRVLLPAKESSEAALWQMAKAHVAANDSGYHQLVSHWLHTHAVVEPFIIATKRQLSIIHPIHRLLDPHFKDTMHINALARSCLTKSGGIFEKVLFSGKVSMDLSAELYKTWRLDEQALPNDLLKRKMALESPDSPAGVELLFQDYPYAADGLAIWSATQTWVTKFCNIFYKDDNSIASDQEIQAWWSEIRNVGHGDKCNETWWYDIRKRTDLIKTLTTLIWTASGLHAAVNFGQYAYNGYPPNRPTLCRKFIPMEGTMEFAQFLSDPDKYFLKMLPDRYEAALGITVMEVMSRHVSEEVYLGQRSKANWTDNEEVLQSFKEFNQQLKKIEKKISKMNQDHKLKNRRGPAGIPYKLVYPDASDVKIKGGITGKGIPNSISL